MYVSAEDEAFMALQREIDARSLSSERRALSVSSDPKEWDCLENMPLAGKNISEWLSELDVLTKQVEAELISRDIGCHLAEVVEAINLVLFDVNGFKRTTVPTDSKCSYLHAVLSSRCGSGKFYAPMILILVFLIIFMIMLSLALT